jgi:hypothetical protein
MCLYYDIHPGRRARMEKLRKSIRTQCPHCGSTVSLIVTSYKKALKVTGDHQLDCTYCGAVFMATRANLHCDVILEREVPISAA